MSSRGHSNREVLETRLRKLRLCSHYRAFSKDVTAAILVFHNNEMAAIRSLTVITINASCLINAPPAPSGFSLTWPASMQIYWNKRKRLHKKRSQLPEDYFGTPTWPPFHCFGTPIWPLWRHVKRLYTRQLFLPIRKAVRFCVNTFPANDSSL